MQKHSVPESLVRCLLMHVQGIMGGGRGQGGGAQDNPNDRAIAEEIGSEVCNADLLEFQRLTEQLGQIKDWLHN